MKKLKCFCDSIFFYLLLGCLAASLGQDLWDSLRNPVLINCISSSKCNWLTFLGWKIKINWLWSNIIISYFLFLNPKFLVNLVTRLDPEARPNNQLDFSQQSDFHLMVETFPTIFKLISAETSLTIVFDPSVVES